MAKADFEKAKAQFPSTQLGEEAWLAFFTTPEGHHAFGRILGDIYDQVKTDEEKARGIRTMGRRPARKATSLQDVYATIFPPVHSLEPFPDALRKLLNGRSQRQFAGKIPIDQATLSKFMSGDRKPSMQMLERIAAAAGVKPNYFVEYRALYVSALVEQVLTAHPNIGIGVHRDVTMARRKFEAVSA